MLEQSVQVVGVQHGPLDALGPDDAEHLAGVEAVGGELGAAGVEDGEQAHGEATDPEERRRRVGPDAVGNREHLAEVMGLDQHIAMGVGYAFGIRGRP